LSGDLLQAVDAAEPDLAARAAELIDCAGEPLAGLTLTGQLLRRRSLLAIVGELLECEDRAGQDSKAGDGLQGGGSQLVLELEATVGEFEALLVGQVRPARQLVGVGQPSGNDQHPGGKQPDDHNRPCG
jgi:hypothetical protein